MKIEILPHPEYPDGLIISIPLEGRKTNRKDAEEIRRTIMARLIRIGYLPKTNELQFSDGAYFFPILTKEGRATLREDIKQTLTGIEERR